jgi:hypothetical protein
MTGIQLAIAAALWFIRLRYLLLRRQEIRGIDIVFCRCLRTDQDRPVRRDPFPRRVRKNGGQIDQPRCLVDGSRLYRGDLMLTGELPRVFGIEPPKPRIEAIRIVDISKGARIGRRRIHRRERRRPRSATTQTATAEAIVSSFSRSIAVLHRVLDKGRERT